VATIARGGLFQAIVNAKQGTNTNIVGGAFSAGNRSTATVSNLMGGNVSLDIRTGALVTSAYGLRVQASMRPASIRCPAAPSPTAPCSKSADWNSGPTYTNGPVQLKILPCTATGCVGFVNGASSALALRVDIGPTATSTPAATFTPTPGVTVTPTPAPDATPILNIVGKARIDEGHLISRASRPPTVGGCGTGPTQPVAGLASDQSGTFTVGTLATGCTLTFVRTWASAPKCFCNDQTAVTLTRCLVTPTTTTAVFTTTTLADISSDVIDYWCIGNE